MPSGNITYQSFAGYNGGWINWGNSTGGYFGRSGSGYYAAAIRFMTPSFSGLSSSLSITIPVIQGWSGVTSYTAYVSLTTADPTLGTAYIGSTPGADAKRIYIGTFAFTGLSSSISYHTITINNSEIKSNTTYYLVLSANGTSSQAGQVYGASNISGTLTYIYPASVPTISKTAVNIGNDVTITTNRQDSSFVHEISYTFGDASGIIGSSVGESVLWTTPLSLANQIPKATSGTCTITCKTYSGSTLLGTKTVTLTLTVPTSMKPTVNSVEVAIDNSDSDVINSWGIAVAGYTKVKVEASASGSYGSTINSFKITGSYSDTKSGDYLSYTGPAIASSGLKSFTIVAIDSRGRSSDSKTSNTIVFYEYFKPSISGFSVARSTDDSTKVTAKANWEFSSVNGENSTTGTLYYKKSSVSSWTTYGVILNNTTTVLDTIFEDTSSYNFRVIVEDALSNTAQEEGFISTIEVLLDFKAGGKGLGVGKICESDAMEVSLDAKFFGNVYIDDILLREYAMRICVSLNLLDNSDFTRFVAQAGVGGAHGTQAYAGDRWILDSGTVTGTANANGDGYSGITLNGTIRQKLATAPTIATAAIGMVSGTATITYADGAVTITSDGGVIQWAALYEGEYTAETMPAYQPKGYAAELAECQRYFCSLKAPSSVYNVVLNGTITNANNDLCVSVPIKAMRIVPTVTFTGKIIVRGVSGYIDSSNLGIAAAVTVAAGNNGVNQTVKFNRSDGSAFTENAVSNSPIQIGFTAGSQLDLSADL